MIEIIQHILINLSCFIGMVIIAIMCIIFMFVAINFVGTIYKEFKSKI